MKTIYFDGQYLKADIQVLEAFAPGVFNATGAFETMLGLDGVVLDTSLHLHRLRSGLKILGVRPPSINPSILKEVLRLNHLTAGRVRLMVWQAGQLTHVMVMALPLKASHKKVYRVCLIQTDHAANDRLAELKSLDYELFAQAHARAKAQGFDEALLLNRAGHIFEASRANIFWIKDRILHTPPLTSGCLSGITRHQVIKHARNLKMPVKETNLTPEILKQSDAAFLTNSLIGIQPIDIKSGIGQL